MASQSKAVEKPIATEEVNPEAEDKPESGGEEEAPVKEKKEKKKVVFDEETKDTQDDIDDIDLDNFGSKKKKKKKRGGEGLDNLDDITDALPEQEEAADVDLDDMDFGDDTNFGEKKKKKKKSKKIVKAAPTGEKTPSYQAMVKQAVVETKSRTGSSLNTVMKFVIGKFPVDAAKAPARILKAVNKLVAAGELVPAAPAGRKGAHRYKLAPPGAGAGFRTALQHSINRKNVFRVSTGSMEFNKLLGGGLESMAITEVFGEFRTGKTQLAHTLCVTTQLPGEGGFTGGKVIYIDTENTFRPDRLRPIADRYNLDQDAVLDNVLYSRAYTSEQLMELLDFVCAKFHEEPGVFKLLVVDSVMALFRVDFSGRGELAERQQNLAQMLSKLQKISEEYNVAVLVTNQMTADSKKPIGGNIIAHASTTRISMRKGRGELRVAKIYDSPDLPESEATFAITAGGLDDAKD